ncbi:MAG: ATPase [Acidobacteriaceae bacterium]
MLHKLQSSGEFEIVGLLTTVNSEFDRVAMHGTRANVLREQAQAVSVPLWTVPLPWPCCNQQYESAMSVAVSRAQREGVEGIAFGDLYLTEIRAYRERQMQGTGIEALFPVWTTEGETHALAQQMLECGLRAKIGCLDARVLDRKFAGRDFDQRFLSELPESVDRCGERGEFHTIAYSGPMFAHALDLTEGETVDREGFVYTDFGIAER